MANDDRTIDISSSKATEKPPWHDSIKGERIVRPDIPYQSHAMRKFVLHGRDGFLLRGASQNFVPRLDVESVSRDEVEETIMTFFYVCWWIGKFEQPVFVWGIYIGLHDGIETGQDK
uniref:Uncharacterized protein n=1 Tax=Aegilops tauschii TaxID=37682 RepID=M8CTK2_AEGTA